MKNKTYFQIITGTIIGALVIVITMSTALIFQNKKIENMEKELYIKKQNEEMATDYYESILNLQTIKTKFNELQDYSILKNNTISMNHTYHYQADAFLGFKKEMELKGQGNVLYNVDVRLSNAIIKQEGKTIYVDLEQPFLDETSIRLAEKSLVMEETKSNLLANDEDGCQAMKFFHDSFIKSAKDNLKDLYSTEAKQQYINKVAEEEVRNLISTLNLNNVTVKVNIIK